ncbi:MAG: PAS domain-containing protein [Nocardioides sp.]
MSQSRGKAERGVSAFGVAVVFALLAVVFALDLTIRLGFAAAMLYVPVVLLSIRLASVRIVVVVSGVAAVLAFLGFLWSPRLADPLPMAYVVGNRIVTVLAIIGCGWVAAAMLRTRDHLVRSNRSLLETQARVHRQTRLLEIAGEVGRFGGWSVDVRNGAVHWSDEVARIHGLDPDELREVETGISYYVPEDQPRITDAFQRCVRDGTPFDEELQLVRQSDGAVRWVNAIGRAERDEHGDVAFVQGALQDITDRIDAQVAAETSRRRLEMLGDSMPFIIWTGTPEGEIDYLSQEFCRYTGVLPGDALGEAWLRLLHPDDREVCINRWAASLASGDPYLVEFRVLRGDGAYRWHLTQATPERNAAGQVVKWWGSAIDIHDGRALEEETNALTLRLAETLESIGDAVLALDTSWRITFVNTHAERLLQRPQAELMGRNIWDVFPEAVGSIFYEEYHQAVAERRPARFGAPFDPLGIYAEVSAYPHDGGLTIYFRDSTEQRALTEQLAHAHRLEAVGQLTGGVAHDFNNLLTVILGSAELIAAELEEGDRLRTLADSIGTVAQRGAELTHSLLAFGRRQPLDPGHVDVNDLVANTQALLARTLGDTVALSCILADGLPACLVDRGQLENALLNLCLNARDAMPGGGRLTLETAVVELDEEYAAHQAEVRPGRYVMLAVSDDGDGISGEHLDKIFEPFFTTKGVGRGSGLGLAMVYGFVKQSNGHITVSSEPRQGTTFKLYLPVDTTGTTADPAPDDDGTDHAGGDETVLLVEDDDAVRSVARGHLAALGYDVLEAADGPAALETLRSDRHIDLLLTDVVMPGGLSGTQLVEIARDLRPDLPTLITSGYTADAVFHEGRPDPGARLLSKPYGRRDLALHVRSALDSREASRR